MAIRKRSGTKPNTLGDTLLDELILRIIGYLHGECRCRLRVVSRRYKALVDTRWEELYHRKWKVEHSQIGEESSSTVSSQEWKNRFFERCRLLYVPKRTLREVVRYNLKGYDEEYFLNKGFTEIHNSMFSEAIQSFTKALQINKSARAYEGLARIHFPREQRDNFITFFGDNEKQNTIQIHYCDMSPYSLVIVYAEESIRQQPVNAAALYYMRAKALFHMKRFRESFTDYSNTLEWLNIAQVYHLGLSNSKAYHDRMLASLYSGNIESAYSDCVEANYGFEEGDCWLEAAKILYDLRDYENVEQFLRHSSSNSVEYHRIKWFLNWRVDNLRKAAQELDKIENSNILCREEKIQAAFTLFQQGRYNDGILFLLQISLMHSDDIRTSSSFCLPHQYLSHSLQPLIERIVHNLPSPAANPHQWNMAGEWLLSILESMVLEWGPSNCLPVTHFIDATHVSRQIIPSDV
eukprot:gb/GECH01001354.1/.p1 GENE.gb/GECH01001354.1/~~gb/GECH01001354.1/.p1  ORF type:complete len:464 (+),score=81.86 gb/GECH01001354.1/:1-1392(+)